MKRNTLLRCEQTGKISFLSEAAAQRRVNKYEDIKRVYYCEHCEGYHLSSRTVNQMLSYDVLGEEEKQGLIKPNCEITIDMVAEKLKELKEKL